MNIVFIGSGGLACPALRRIAASADYRIVEVVTQPERPSGRGRRTAGCPLKHEAELLGLPMSTPQKISEKAFIRHIGDLKPDLILVVAYGQFLPAELLEIPALGAINIHPSLLPRYRGAAPIQWSLINGDDITGVTILFMTERMDAGDIIRQTEVQIDPEDDAASLESLLAEIGADLLVTVLDDFRCGTINRIPQNEGEVVFAPKLKKADGRLDLELPARKIINLIRGLYPWPCCVCIVPEGDGMPLRILKAREESGNGQPGEIIDINTCGPLVATGVNAVRLLRVQPPGKPPMGGRDFCNGHHIKPGYLFRSATGNVDTQGD